MKVYLERNLLRSIYQVPYTYYLRTTHTTADRRLRRRSPCTRRIKTKKSKRSYGIDNIVEYSGNEGC